MNLRSEVGNVERVEAVVVDDDTSTARGLNLRIAGDAIEDCTQTCMSFLVLVTGGASEIRPAIADTFTDRGT